jgi:hypothetical protein
MPRAIFAPASQPHDSNVRATGRGSPKARMNAIADHPGDHARVAFGPGRGVGEKAQDLLGVCVERREIRLVPIHPVPLEVGDDFPPGGAPV